VSGRWLGMACAMLVLAAPHVVRAEVFAVPASLRAQPQAFDETHVLRTVEGTVVGEQRSTATVRDDRLSLDIVTRFANGERWDERAEMDLAEGYRARAFTKSVRRAGAVVAEQKVDFHTGEVTWRDEKGRGARTIGFTPDTYMGPMMGVILAAVPGIASRTASFQALIMNPEPALYTVRAQVMGQEDYRLDAGREPASKIRVRADLGAVQNALFAPLIPTHYFWFTRADPPEFLAFEGTLGYGGPDVQMVPKSTTARTALVN
jgi:hypothetical protein